MRRGQAVGALSRLLASPLTFYSRRLRSSTWLSVHLTLFVYDSSALVGLHLPISHLRCHLHALPSAGGRMWRMWVTPRVIHRTRLVALRHNGAALLDALRAFRWISIDVTSLIRWRLLARLSMTRPLRSPLNCCKFVTRSDSFCATCLIGQSRIDRLARTPVRQYDFTDGRICIGQLLCRVYWLPLLPSEAGVRITDKASWAAFFQVQRLLGICLL